MKAKCYAKRVLSVLLVATIFVSVFSLSAAAAGMSVACEDTLEGNTLTVSVYFTNGGGFETGDLRVDYDPSVLTFIEHKNAGTDAEAFILESDYYQQSNSNTPGIILWGCMFVDCLPASGALSERFHAIDLIFTVNSGAESSLNGTEIKVSGSIEINGGDDQFEATYSVTSGTAPNVPEEPDEPDGPQQPGGDTVQLKPMGDVDGDGSTTSSDARIILRCSVGLESIDSANLAYANVDCDESVSSSDARLALRTSVGLEDVQMHYFALSGSTYVCSHCDVSFSIPSVGSSHVHNYKHVGCNVPLRCDCGAQSGKVPNHKINQQTTICTICGVNLTTMSEVIGYVNNVTDYSNSSLNAALREYNYGDYYDFFDNIIDYKLYLKLIVDKLSGLEDFKVAYDYFYKAYKLLDDALYYVTDYDGMITTNYSNASYVKNKLPTVMEYNQVGLEALMDVVEVYLELLE